MYIGAMRFRAWLQSKTETQDAEGGIISAWSTVAFMFAQIDNLSGKELEIARQSQAEATDKITIRWQNLFGYSDLTKMRFLAADGGEIFNITSVIEPGFRHEFLECYCARVTGRSTLNPLTNTSGQVIRNTDGNPYFI